MGIFISVEKTIECIVVAFVYAGFLALMSYKQLGILQSCGYNGKKYWAWLTKKGNMTFTRFSLMFLLCLFSSVVLSLCFAFLGKWSAVVGLVPTAIFFICYYFADKKIALRSPVARTARFNRLYVTLFVLLGILCYIAVTLLNFADEVIKSNIFSLLRYCPLSLFPVLLLPIILFANCIIKIYEVPHSNKFIKKATKKLSETKIKVVGITGSYGKTSTKQILAHILSKKYRVLSTPRSYNTPLGISRCINNSNLSDYDIFIAEMGARNSGDIAELCAICPPDISVITGICEQHLESFKSFSAIVKAKGEILQATKDRAFIADDCYELFEPFACNKVRCSSVSDIKADENGVEFTLTLGGNSRRAKSILLGEHSARNIALASLVAFNLGMTIDEIVDAISDIPYVEHRLQLIKNNGVNIIDDGYNANIKGARSAIEVLKSFHGRKIVVTPGLVELGVLEESENFELGKNLAGFDLVILVGDTLVAPINKGYLSVGGDKEKLITCPTLFTAQEYLRKYITSGDTVLFLNDLPDVY
jgi:UDP-N-acetylmuramoyl-tripeptide--D-alanyl-D-alanine ligase